MQGNSSVWSFKGLSATSSQQTFIFYRERNDVRRDASTVGFLCCSPASQKK